MTTAAAERIRAGCRSGGQPVSSVGKVYLRAHSTHLTLVVDHPKHRKTFPCHEAPGEGDPKSQGGRVVVAVRHFNLTNWEVATALVEKLAANGLCTSGPGQGGQGGQGPCGEEGAGVGPGRWAR